MRRRIQTLTQRCPHPRVQCSIIHKSRDTGSLKCPLMDARKMEHYSAMTEEEILLFVTPEVDLEGLC